MPHSDIHGSKPARGSPWLFAACHVLHRLLVPRHPPNALIALDNHAALTPEGIKNRINPSCTGAIHTIACVAALIQNRPFTQHITQRLCAQSPRSLDAPSQRQSGQTTRPTARAETHQNLIHSNKEHAGTKTSAPRSPAAQRNRRSRPKGAKPIVPISLSSL